MGTQAHLIQDPRTKMGPTQAHLICQSCQIWAQLLTSPTSTKKILNQLKCWLAGPRFTLNCGWYSGKSGKSCQKSLILSQKSPRWLWECIVRISSGPKKTLVLRMVEHRIEYMHLASEYSRCLLEKYGLTRWSTMFFYPLILKGPCCICGVHMIQVIDAHISVPACGKSNCSKANLQYLLGYSAIRFWHWVVPRQNYQIYLL